MGNFGGTYSVAVDRMTPGDVWTAKRFISRMAEGASSFSLVERRLAYVDPVSADGGTLLAAVSGASSGFVTAFDTSGTLLWSTYLGGHSSDYATSVSAQAGSVHITGVTNSELWPLARAGPRPFGGASDLFGARYVILQ